MSGYEQRLAADKAEIRQRVVNVGNAVKEAVQKAITALLARDTQTAYRLVLGDLPINREVRAIDARCNAFIARHLPSAGHLRFVSAVLQMNVALERIGDYAVTIAREAVHLSSPIPERLEQDLKSMAEQAVGVLGDALAAFSERDVELARRTRPRAKSVERSYGETYKDLTREGATIPLADAFALLAVFRRLERVADQAKNLSEETLFELTGEQKAPKKYKILFVDQDGALLAPLAEALARKGFPGSGDYASAAAHSLKPLSSHLQELSDRRGVDLADVRPQPLPQKVTDLEAYNVIVALGEDSAGLVAEVPYVSALLQWPIKAPGAEASTDELDSLTNELSQQIRELMVLMRGEDAP